MMTDDRMTLVGDAPLSLFDFVGLVRGNAPIALSDDAKTRIAAARAIVETYAAGDEPVYGLNTGLGGNLGFRIDRDDILAFQTQFVLGRNIGLGDALPEASCRAALLARITEFVPGGAGVSRGTLDLLVAMFNRGVTPVLPGRGSISAGDLGIAAHGAAVLFGQGEAWFAGERLSGAEALARAGLAPITLEPKDGLVLCNHSCPGTGHGAVVLADFAATLRSAAAVAALAFEGYGANAAIFDPRLHAARPAAGQVGAAALFRALLDGSSIHANPRRIQDAVSFRCLAPNFGAALASFAVAKAEIETEFNSSADTPLVLIAERQMLSAPNFHTVSLALAFEQLSLVVVHLASAGAQRIIKLMNPALSGLPKYLSPVGGASAGYVPLQKTTAALHAEIRHGGLAVALDAYPVSDTVEDIAPLTLLAIQKLERQLVTFKLLLAVEALVAAQAVDLREGLRLSPAGTRLHGAIRAIVPTLRDDRAAGPDVMAVHDLIATSAMQAAILASMAACDLAIAPRTAA